MALDLYQDQINENLAKLTPTQDVEPGAFANFFSGAGQAAMRGFAEVPRAMSMATAVAPIAMDAFNGTSVAKERYFKWHDEVFGRAVDYWTPKPNEIGVAGEVTGKLLSMLPIIMSGAAGPGLAVGATQLTAAEDLVRKNTDVTATQANLVGAVQGAGLGLGIWMPILGQNLAQRVVIGGVGFNVAQGVATRAISGQILEGTKAAKEFEAFDGTQLTLDVLLGLAFGGIAHYVPAQRAQGAEAWAKIRDWAQNLKPSEIDALLVLREAQHINEDSLPGKPATPADASAHVDRVRQAIDQLASDRQVNVQDIKVPRGTFQGFDLDPPTEGNVRVYRGETAARAELPEWIKQDLKETGALDAQGRWWTTDPTIAKWYVDDAGETGRMLYQDVPAAVVQQSRVSGLPDAIKRFSADPENELFLPKEYVGRGQEPQYAIEPSKIKAAEQTATDLQEAAQRVRIEEGLPRVPDQQVIPPRDITPLEPVAQARAVGQHIERKLIETGMQRDEAVANAAVWEAFAKSAYERYGIPPAELLTKYGVDVKRMDSADKLLGALDQSKRVEDYGGEHRPPGPDNGAPAHDLTGGGAVYPDDVYGPNAARFYGHGEDELDRQTIAILHSLKGKPDAKVKVYRAVPDDITVSEKLAKLEKQMAAYMRRGTVPDGETAAGWYDRVAAERDRLQALPQEPNAEKTGINAGDWVTVNRAYAKAHAEGALKGGARIIAKSVKASEIFTNGDSIHEFGYWPKGSAPDTLYQDQPFYSQLTRSIEGLKTTSAPAKGWKDTIKGLVSKGQVKQAEIETTGLNEWLDLQQGKVTKQQVQDFLSQNGVRVEEVELGGKARASEAMRRAVNGENNSEISFTPEQWQEQSEWFGRTAQSWQRNGDQAQAHRYFELAEEANMLAEGVDPESGSTAGMPKFSQYQLPGGDNYRELLLTLPQSIAKTEEGRSSWIDFAKNAGKTENDARLTWHSTGREADPLFKQWMQWQGARVGGPDFKSSHFDQPNILAHIRFNERTDAEGKKVLFIEEIQSDWAQKGKKEGFTDVKPAPTPREISVAQNEALAAIRGEDNLGYDTPGQAANALYSDYRTEGAAVFNRYEMTAELRAALQNWFEVEGRVAQKGIPHAPFVGKTEAWVALSLKRMIRYAAENGFERIAWTTGEQQAARYDLSKQVDAILHSKNPDGTFNIDVEKDGRSVLAKQNQTPAQLEELIGKDIAQKIVDGEGTSGNGEIFRLSGNGLKVGGEGMKAFYDKIVPNIANDVLKKMGGGRVGEFGFDLKKKFRDEADANIEQQEGLAPGTIEELRRRRGGWTEVETTPFNFSAPDKQPGFDITPTLREKAMAGVPLFQGGARGSATSFGQTGQSLIHLFENADKSTFQHETGHVFLEMTRDLANRPDVPMAAVQDWATLSKWLKIEGGPITREAHEQFARGWEKYLAEGVAPNEGLKGAFKRFRDWLIDIYKSLTNMDVELNNQVRGVMARMLENQARDPVSKGGLDDPRLQTKEYRDALERMGREAGWQQTGGSIMRERTGNEAAGEPAQGEVVGRTEWIPHAEWYARMQASAANVPGVGGANVRRAVQKALMGEPMSVGEKRAVTWMLDEHMAVIKRWDEVHSDSGRNPFEIDDLQHAEGIEPTRENTLNMALVDRALQVDREAYENIPTNLDDAAYMAAVKEIVDAHKPEVERPDQGGAQVAAQTEHVGPQRAAGGTGSPPPPSVAGEAAGGAAAPNMVAKEARRIAMENPDMKVRVGTEADGAPIYKSLNDMLDDAELDAAIAREDMNLITVAAECLMGVA